MVGGGVNGGYLLSVLGAAVAETSGAFGHPDPFIVTAHYLSASRPGPATVSTSLLRNGRSLTTVAATMTQEQDGADVPRLTALASYGDLHGLTDEVATTAEEPDLPRREQCVPTSAAPEDFRRTAPLLDRFDLLVDPACVGWALGEPSGRGMLQGWFRLNDEREPDAQSLLLAVDALPPVTFDLGLIGLGADARADRARAGPSGAGLAEAAPRHTQRGRRLLRGGLRGVGRGRPAGRAVAAAGPDAPPRLTSRCVLPLPLRHLS